MELVCDGDGTAATESQLRDRDLYVDTWPSTVCTCIAELLSQHQSHGKWNEARIRLLERIGFGMALLRDCPSEQYDVALLSSFQDFVISPTMPWGRTTCDRVTATLRARDEFVRHLHLRLSETGSSQFVTLVAKHSRVIVGTQARPKLETENRLLLALASAGVTSAVVPLPEPPQS